MSRPRIVTVDDVRALLDVDLHPVRPSYSEWFEAVHVALAEIDRLRVTNADLRTEVRRLRDDLAEARQQRDDARAARKIAEADRLRALAALDERYGGPAIAALRTDAQRLGDEIASMVERYVTRLSNVSPKDGEQ